MPLFRKALAQKTALQKRKALRSVAIANIKGLRKSTFSPEYLKKMSNELRELHPELALATRFSAMEKSNALKRMKKIANAKR